MICVSSGLRCSLLFLALFVVSQTLAQSVISTAPNKCSNVCYEIKTLLQEMKKQLTQMQNDINILKGKRTAVKGKDRSDICVIIFFFFINYFLKAVIPRAHGGNIGSCAILQYII